MLPALMIKIESGVLEMKIQPALNAFNGAMHVQVVQALLSLILCATSGIIIVHMISEVVEVLIFGWRKVGKSF